MPAREDGPRADLETLFGCYAARLKDFSISEAAAERERNVVRQEHDYRVSSRPFVRFARKLDRLLIPDHPAGQWAIGLPEDIAAITLDDARAFHRNWYVLNNVYFVVKADLDPASLKEIAERALADIKPRRLPARPAAQPPAIVAERTDIREQDAAVKRPGVYFKKLVHIEEGSDNLTGPARGLVTNFLQSRLPGSLYDALVEQDKLAAGAVAISMSRIAPKTVVLSIGADVAPDVAPEALLAGISDYVEKLGANGISVDAIERLKKRSMEASAIADKDPRRVYSRLVAWLAARNRYEELARAPERIAAVTPDHVAVVVKGLAGPGRIVTGTLTPAEGRP
jgi:zinc protease